MAQKIKEQEGVNNQRKCVWIVLTLIRRGKERGAVWVHRTSSTPTERKVSDPL